MRENTDLVTRLAGTTSFEESVREIDRYLDGFTDVVAAELMRPILVGVAAAVWSRRSTAARPRGSVVQFRRR
ncbi:hypothetical protein [Rhizobium leguminosarum]|uniref:Uncharacterized protein n=1 Tax=Rhizobium leguminosarum TaxID=384 RepID=A0A7K3VEW3_RHILE|nr:hypothetical protein [Rhizobium leguminosarum]NEK15703.1 hypothetical protein [Rhizobium leguminosarum]